MVKVSFYTLTGSLRLVKTETFKSVSEAVEAARKYAEPEGYTNIKETEDDPIDGFRITGTTPNGRAGRNIAFGDWDE
jgi:hypothetical protein